MIEALLFALSTLILLSSLDAKDVRYHGAELDRIHKRSTSNPNNVILLVQDAKTNNKDAIRILEELHSHATIVSSLELANKELEHVNATSPTAILIVELRNGLWYDAHGLHEMLSAYETTREGMSKIKLLTAAYYATFACIDLVRALAEVIIDPSQNISVAAENLLSELNVGPVNTTVPDKVYDLVAQVLTMTASQGGEH